MDLHPTRDQEELIDVTADYLRRELPASRLPHQKEATITHSQWRGLADMGWFAMGLSEEQGGLGLSLVEEALIVREFGRQLLPPAAAATMLAVHVAAAAGDDQLADAFARGSARAGLAFRADPSLHLLDGDAVSHALIWDEAGLALVPVAALSNRHTAQGLDFTVTVVVADEPPPEAALRWEDEEATLRASVLVGAALTGMAEGVRDLAADYARERHQFGRPIGSFQAVAHPCADMAVRSDAALSMLMFASVCVRDRQELPALYASAFRAVAGDAAYRNAVAAMQVFGGYGQTYEYLPHFFLKRAVLMRAFGGGVEEDLKRVLAAETTF
jgi:alkylation response protein AidB-like acyl-CoA dehydrogenase